MRKKMSIIKQKSILLVFGLVLSINSFSQIGFQNHVIVDDYNTALGVKSVCSADIDEDGNIDVVSASYKDNEILWFRNDGTGNFETPQIISTLIGGPTSVCANDIDGDGDVDIIVAYSLENRIIWFENINGGFNTQHTIADFRTYSIVAVDIDGDGDIDIASGSDAHFGVRVAWFENVDGLGNFGEQQNINEDAGSDARSIFASDFDGDGDMDILATANGRSEFVWYRNTDGLGNFGSQQLITFSTRPKTVYAKDIDGDGDMDAVLGSQQQVGWCENLNGLGNFGTFQVFLEAYEIGISSVYAEDIDGDGDNDILAASYSDDNVSLYENLDGNGNFDEQEIIVTNAMKAYTIIVDDIDNDGDMDVVTGSAQDNKITWSENTTGNGDFEDPQIIYANTTYGLNYPKTVSAADIDNDGDMDVLAAEHGYDNLIVWYENINSQGDFEEQQVIDSYNDKVDSICVGDLNGDGNLDVIVSTNEWGGEVSWYENIDGNGTFGTKQTVSDWRSRSNCIIDLNEDGYLDVISGGGNRIVWSENNGEGSFINHIITTEPESISAVFAIDVDGDGDIDILSSDMGDDTVTWYENLDGQGDFSDLQLIASNILTVNQVYGADIDNDGDTDVVFSSGIYDRVYWSENTNGIGYFGPKQTVTNESNNPKSIAVTDIDNDGFLDVICASSTDDKVSWYKNIDGAGNFGEQQIITTEADGASAVFTSDINGDGYVDIISASSLDDKIAWYENLGVLGNEINGTVLFDIDLDGCDSEDIQMQNTMLISDNGYHQFATFSDFEGNYTIKTNEGFFTTEITSSFSDYFSINPAYHTSNFIGLNNVDTANFCVQENSTINDVNVSIYPTSVARPGFEASYKIVFSNTGTTQMNGSILLEYDNLKLSFLSSSVTVDNETSNTIEFNYEELNPFTTKSIDLLFSVFEPPIVNNNDTLSYIVNINPVDGDNTSNDNSFTLNQTVVNSFDPNDIQVLEGDHILIDNIDQYLHYIIRFQNTGTADAINVTIENEFSRYLDWQSMQLEELSHQGEVSIINGEVAKFIFENINLPSSESDEPNSHGYITYKIKPVSDVNINNIISNNALIFFDFNDAVETNTVTTQIIENLSSNQFEINTLIKVYPNPAEDYINIIAHNTDIVKVDLINTLGQIVLTKIKTDIRVESIDISSVKPGFYRLKAKDNNGRIIVSKILIK